MSFKPVNYLPYDFANRRHIGPSKSEINDMLKVIGCESINDLIEDRIEYDPNSQKDIIYSGFKNTKNNEDFINANSAIKFFNLAAGFPYSTFTPPNLLTLTLHCSA